MFKLLVTIYDIQGSGFKGSKVQKKELKDGLKFHDSRSQKSEIVIQRLYELIEEFRISGIQELKP